MTPQEPELPNTFGRTSIHAKYQRMLGLDEVEMRWCERLSALSLESLTTVATRFAQTRDALTLPGTVPWPGTSPL